MPTVSIIVTTYNRKDQLNKAIKSILDQTYQDFELMVIDDFSEYDFNLLIKEFNNPKIKAHQNKSNGIISVNRNIGIKNSIGQYLAFCDDDDFWLPDKLEKQMDVINKYPKTQKLLIHTNCECFGPDIKNFVTKKKKIGSINDLVFENYITLSSALVYRSEFVIFDEFPELKAAEDFFYG